MNNHNNRFINECVKKYKWLKEWSLRIVINKFKDMWENYCSNIDEYFCWGKARETSLSDMLY